MNDPAPSAGPRAVLRLEQPDDPPEISLHDDLAAPVQILARLIDKGTAVRLELEVDGVLASASSAALGQMRLSSADRSILAAVRELATKFGGPPTGLQISTLTKYPYDSHFKSKLASLRRRGLLGGMLRETGYPLTDLGAAMLAAPGGSQ